MFDGVKIFMKITKNRSEKFLVKEQLPLKVLSTLLKEPFQEKWSIYSSYLKKFSVG